MNRIEKEIKEKSIHLIESSLPGIDSLDNIPEKPIKVRTRPMIFIPIGAAALLLTAILIPSIIKCSGVSEPIENPVTNPTGKTPTNPNDNVGQTTNPIGENNHSSRKYVFDLDNYNPTFENFNEVTYYSYLAYSKNEKNAPAKALYAPKGLSEDNNDVEAEVETEVENDREPYTDYYGRYHYPLALDEVFTFSNFLYFEFETEGNEFLEERIGNGHIYGLALDVRGSFLDEGMIILKNNEKYYSCLTNGGSVDKLTRIQYATYSSHKIIEGFDVIKDLANMRYINLYSDVNNSNLWVTPTTATSITIEKDNFPIIEDSVYYDGITVSCSIGEIRQLFGLDSNFSLDELTLREDKVVYDADEPETNTFIIEEFSDEFTVSNGDLYLGENKLLRIDNATKIYVSDINKDSYRDIVFETYESSGRKFIVYDAYRNTYLFEKSESELVEGFDYYLCMKDNRVAFKIFQSGKTDDKYLIDYGIFAYGGSNGIEIQWINYYQLNSIALGNIYESDGQTPTETMLTYTHSFASNTTYYVDLYLKKDIYSQNSEYPEHDDPIICEYNDVDCTPCDYVTWKLVASYGRGNYRYEISFSLSEEFSLRFRYKGLNLTLAFSVIVDADQLIHDEI